MKNMKPMKNLMMKLLGPAGNGLASIAQLFWPGMMFGFAAICLTSSITAISGCAAPPNWSAACEHMQLIDAEAGDFASQPFVDDGVAATIQHFRAEAAPVIAAVCAIADDPDAADPTSQLTLILDQVLAWAIAEERDVVAMWVYAARVALRQMGIGIPAYEPPAKPLPIGSAAEAYEHWTARALDRAPPAPTFAREVTLGELSGASSSA